MPFRTPFHKNHNRSQGSIVSQERPDSRTSFGNSPLPSPSVVQHPQQQQHGEEVAHFPPPTQTAHPGLDDRHQHDQFHNHSDLTPPAADEAYDSYQQPLPRNHHHQIHTPSLSKFSGHRPTFNLAGGAAQRPATGESDPQPPLSGTSASLDHQQAKEPKKSIRSWFGNISSREGHRTNPSESALPAGQSNPSSNSAGGLGRKISRRQKDAPVGLRHSVQQGHSPQDPPPPENWQSSSNHNTYLPPSHEEDEDARLDPYSANTGRGEPAGQSRTAAFDRPAGLQSPPDDLQGRGPIQRVNSDDYYPRRPAQPGQRELPPAPHQTTVNAASQFQPAPCPSPQPQPYQAYQPTSSDPATGRLSPEDHRRLGQTSQLAYQQVSQQPEEKLSSRPTPAQQAPPAQQQQWSQKPGSQQFQAYNAQPQAPSNRISAQNPSHTRQGSMGPPPTDTARSGEGNTQIGPGPPQRETSNPSQAGQTGQGTSQPPTPGRGQQFGPPPTATVQQGQNSRGGGTASQQTLGQQNMGGEHERANPQGRSKDDIPPIEGSVHQELQGKYSKVKKLYFEKMAQVEQLQNTLAHQRLSQSRTSLDDSEYATRFNRLDGAIGNLAFNIRKDWRKVPPWLERMINRDAHLKGTKEMTVVGRAAISRWVVEAILERYFHPGLDPALSSQLKIIEKNIRILSNPPQTQEEEDALLAKVSAWRLTTADGLQDALSAPKAAENRAALTSYLVTDLTAALGEFLNDPPPPDLEGGVSMIVELAVGIAANLPLESRDVFVYYPLPLEPIVPEITKLETGLPPLAVSIGGSDDADGDRASLQGNESQNTDSKDHSLSNEPRDSDSSSLTKKKHMFGGLMGKKDAGPRQGGPPGSQNLSAQAPQQQQQQQQQQQGQRPSSPANVKDDIPRVRVAAFMAVEVRGRSVLCKAPVYSL